MPNNVVQISVVVPVYNEEQSIKPFLDRLLPVLENICSTYEVLFCLDPCADQTEAVIREAMQQYPQIRLLILSRRFGQPAATMAGILNCRGDACVVIDVDLQDPPEIIEELYKVYKTGYDVVYAKRNSRKGETRLRLWLTHLGYWLIHRLSDVKIPRNTGDFRIISRRVIEHLRELRETHGFLKGLVSFVGFKQAAVLYDRDERHQGKSKYNRFWGSLNISFNGIFCFSSLPLQFITMIGGLLTVVSFVLGICYLLQKLLAATLIPGLSATILALAFLSGIQLLSIGLLGEYISRIYNEVKRRPMYIIDEIVEDISLD